MFFPIWLLISFVFAEMALALWAMAKINSLLLQIHDQEQIVDDAIAARRQSVRREDAMREDLRSKEATITFQHYQLNGIAGRPSMTHNVLDGSPRHLSPPPAPGQRWLSAVDQSCRSTELPRPQDQVAG